MGPTFLERALHVLERLLLGAPGGGGPHGWVGPRFETWCEGPPGARHVLVTGFHHPHGPEHRVLRVGVRVEGQAVGGFTLDQAGRFERRLPLPAGLLPPLRLALESEPSFVPDEVLHNGDTRRLCFVLDTLRLVP